MSNREYFANRDWALEHYPGRGRLRYDAQHATARTLQLDGHTTRISYAPEAETGIERRGRIIHGIDHERLCTGDSRDLGGIDDRIARQSGAKAHPLEIVIHAEHPKEHSRDLGGSVTGEPSAANIGSHDGMRAQCIEARYAPGATRHIDDGRATGTGGSGMARRIERRQGSLFR